MRGCPQEVLSPLVWSLVMDGLLDDFTQEGYYVQGYANDIALLVYGKFPNRALDSMNQELSKIHNWCMQEGLSINPSKTVVVPFTNRRNLSSLGNLRLGNFIPEYSKLVKYLGITLDKKLTWNVHIDNILRRARWSLSTIKHYWNNLGPKTTH